MKRLAMLLLCGCSSAPHDFGTDAGTSDDTSMPANACTLGYPLGSYGTTPGKVVNPGFTWQGFLPGSNSASAITPGDLFDCDGSKGINALVFDVSAEWCAACQSQAANMKQLSAQDTALGIRMVTLVVQDSSQAPATITTDQDWKTQYALSDITVCADPGFAFAPANPGSVQLPVTVLVDPRTMKIVKVTNGYIAAYPISPDADAVALAKHNGAM